MANKSKMKKRKVHTLLALVIVHGKSEMLIVQKIKTSFRQQIEIYSRDNGRSSIQVTSIVKELNRSKILNSVKNFKNHYTAVEANPEKGIPINNPEFKIFTVMDLDDCTQEQAEAYKNKSLFLDHWAYDWIVPIYNSPNLEEVMTRAGLPFRKKGIERKKRIL